MRDMPARHPMGPDRRFVGGDIWSLSTPSACRHADSGAFVSQMPSAGPGAAGVVVAGSARRPALRETDLSSQGSAVPLRTVPGSCEKVPPASPSPSPGMKDRP